MKRFIPLALLMLLFSGTAKAQALSRQDILNLSSAGVSDDIITQKIQKDGISFDMSADAILELRKAGLSNGVIKKLLAAKVNKPESSPSIIAPDINLRAQELYRAGKYGEAADYLKRNLSTNPSDYKSRAILILSLLKLNENASANQEFSELKANSQDPIARKYVEKLETLLALLEKQREGKARLLTALKNFNAQEVPRPIFCTTASERVYITTSSDKDANGGS